MIATNSDIVPKTGQVPLIEVEWPKIEGTARIDATFACVTADQLGRRNLENCRLALVSFQNSHTETINGLDRDLKTAEVLLLPCTWKDLVGRAQGDRRALEPRGKDNMVQFGRVRIELSSMEVWRGEVSVRLTAMEFNVLCFFMRNPNRVLSRDQLLNEVWGYENYPCTRTVDSHIMRLRQKLEPDPANPTHFRTVHGIGYKFVA